MKILLVILTTGHYTAAIKPNPAGNPASTGDAIKLTRAFGVPLYNEWLLMSSAASKTLPGRNSDNTADANKTARFYINSDGKRFFDEYTWNYNLGFRVENDETDMVWAVFSTGDMNMTAEQLAALKARVVNNDTTPAARMAVNDLTYGATLDELADNLGLSADAKARFLKTVAEFNAAYAAAASDPTPREVAIPQGSNDYIQPTFWFGQATPLLSSGGKVFTSDTGTDATNAAEGYYAQRSSFGSAGTMGGPQVDHHFRAIKGSLIATNIADAPEAQRVKGLYIAGEASLSNVHGGSRGGPYAGGGFGTSAAFYGGFLAGRTVLKDFETVFPK